MDQLERKESIRARLRRAWDTALRVAEVMSLSPTEELSERIDRLEREVTAISKKSQNPNGREYHD